MKNIFPVSDMAPRGEKYSESTFCLKKLVFVERKKKNVATTFPLRREAIKNILKTKNKP